MLFCAYYLGSSYTIHECKLKCGLFEHVLADKFSREKIVQHIHAYIEMFVRCRYCNSLDTKLVILKQGNYYTSYNLVSERVCKTFL